MFNIFKKIRLKRNIKWGIAAFIFIIIASFVTHRQGNRVIPEVRIDILNKFETYFVSEDDIRDIIIHNFQSNLKGDYVENVNLNSVEKAVEKDKFVESAQVFRDLKGNIIIQVKQHKPIARVVHPDTSYYLGDKRNTLPLSKRFAARVILISGNVEEYYLKNNRTDTAFLSLINKIGADSFLTKQVAQLDVDKTGSITMYMQMSKQTVVFGKPINMDRKLRKVKVFYDKIIKNKGYNTYSNVNVSFKNQIVCE